MQHRSGGKAQDEGSAEKEAGAEFHAWVLGVERAEISKAFFFAKKKQKTLRHEARGGATARPNGQKFFGSFF
jgi:hypothetical protein